jgi:hypothetical protein
MQVGDAGLGPPPLQHRVDPVSGQGRATPAPQPQPRCVCEWVPPPPLSEVAIERPGRLHPSGTARCRGPLRRLALPTT